MSLYVRLSCDVLTDAKLLEVGPEGFTLWAKGLLYAKLHMTDGFIPEAALSLIGLGIGHIDVTVASLVTARLWERCAGGYRVDPAKWARWQTTKAEVDALRASARERQQKSRFRRQTGSDRSSVTPAVTCDIGVTHTDVTLVSHNQSTEHRAQSTERDTPLPPQGAETQQVCEVVLVGVGAAPPWWEGLDPADPARQVAEAVVAPLGPKGRWYEPPGREPCEALAEKVVAIVGLPEFGEAWGALREAWLDYHAGRRKKPYERPLRALSEWAAKREPDWRRIRRNREIDAERAQRGPNGRGQPGLAGQVAGALAILEGGSP